MCHTPGGGTEVSDSAVRRLLRRLDNAGGGPTLKQWAQLVEADKAGRGAGARRGHNHVPEWLSIAERLGNEKAVSSTMLKGHQLAESGVPRGPLWAFMVAQSEEAQDNGAFTDEDGARAWLQANQEQVVAEARRRQQEHKAAFEKKKAAQLAELKIRQAQQKAEARAVKEAKSATAAQAVS